MRIAISGSHATGKSTLARSVADLYPTYSVVDEPYHFMVAEGVWFSDPPVFEDFEAQLDRSAALIVEHRDPEIIFERCPIDFFAYLSAFRTNPEDSAAWFKVVKESIQTIDLIAYVPIESPDRIAVASDEHLKLRRVVDRKLRTLLVNDGLGLELNVVEVRGSVHDRVRQLVAHLQSPVR
jgi:hypothetical protein